MPTLSALEDADLALLISSGLTCGETTWLRASCRGCAALFVRNIPCGTSETLYFEDRERPPGSTRTMFLRHEMIYEHTHRNRFSPMRCWRFQLADARSLGVVNADLARRLLRKRSVVLAAVKQEGLALEFADERLKSDRDIVLAAVTQNGEACHHADSSLQSDRDVVLAAVSRCGEALAWAADSLKRDRDVVLAAVANTGNALKYADRSFRSDRDVVLAAVAQEGRALRIADDSLKHDRQIVLVAVAQDGGALEYADESLNCDRDIVLRPLHRMNVRGLTPTRVSGEERVGACRRQDTHRHCRQWRRRPTTSGVADGLRSRNRYYR